jgi:hypothetical protein
MLCVVVLVVGCGGGGDALQASLDDEDLSDGFWAIRATCEDGRVDVEFDPGVQVSAAGFGRASGEEIAVECGEPERVSVSNEELRARTETASGADLATPSSEPRGLSCVTDGPVVVEAHPVWSQDAVVGGALRVEGGGSALVEGAITREGYTFPSELRWWPARCRTS